MSGMPRQADLLSASFSGLATRTAHYAGLWLAIHFYQHGLESIANASDEYTVIVDEDHGRPIVWQASCAAVKQGVKPAMPLAMAQSLCHELTLIPRDEAAEKRRLKHHADWAYQYSSQVYLFEPQTIVFEVERSLSLFGGLNNLSQHVSHALTQLSSHTHVAVAPTNAAARLLAENGLEQHVLDIANLRDTLRYQPIHLFPLPVKKRSSLQKIGVQTFNDFWLLPETDLARRIGPQAIALMEAVLGLRPDLQPSTHPVSQFSERTELYRESDNVTVFLKVLRPMLANLHTFLLSHDAGIQRCKLVLEHRKHDNTEINVGFQHNERDAEQILSMIEQRLAHLNLPALVSYIGLAVDEWQEYAPASNNLFTSQQDQHWQQTLELLRMRLGFDAVYQLDECDDYRPEHAWQCQPIGHIKSSHVQCDAGPEQPLALLHRGIIAADPARHWTFLTSAERVESGWWDGNDCRRDYYRVRIGQQEWWVYQDLRTQQWYQQGIFI